jgi:hypothetical protein
MPRQKINSKLINTPLRVGLIKIPPVRKISRLEIWSLNGTSRMRIKENIQNSSNYGLGPS